MRAHSQRRTIWILNGVLGLALLGVAAWFALDVRKAIAQPSHLKPAFADDAVEAFQALPDGETSGPPLAVQQKELDEIDVPAFKKQGGRGRFHWLYSGPKPPPPPKVEEIEGPKAPVISDLEKLGKVHMLIYIPPRRGETVADETVIAWRFGEGPKSAVEEFRPGEFLIEPGKDRGNIRFVNVVPRGGSFYDISYNVYDDAHKVDEVPTGEPRSSGMYEYDGRVALDKEVQDRIRLPVPASAATAAAAGSGDPGVPKTAVVAGTPGVDGEPGTTDTPEPPEAEDLQPIVKWENARRARVEFDQKTYDYFQGGDAQKIAKTIKTQVYKDAQGNVAGLQFTGLSDDSAARKFDVRRGDILVSIDGKPVTSRDSALNIIQGMNENVRSVTVVLLRDGKEITYVIDPQDPKTRREGRYLDNLR